MKLQDCKFVVTGAARGMGAHFVKQLVAEGAKVAAGDIDEEELQRSCNAIEGAPGTLYHHVLDVACDESIASFVEWANDKLSGLNGVISNAGILRDGLLVKKDRKNGEITPLDRKQWQQVIDVNLTGSTMVVRDVVASMMRQETPGVVINMSSLARHGNRGQSNYVASKAAVAANTVTWAREFGRYGIRVGAIAPGMIETPMTANMTPKAREALVKAVPCGRIGTADDVWRGVKFIIECDYFTGAVLDIHGGLHM